MPGLLSDVFDEGSGSGSSTEAQTTDLGLDSAQDIDLDLAVGVGFETGGTFQTLDGSTTTWSNSADVGVDADFGAMLGGSLGQDTFQDGTDHY